MSDPIITMTVKEAEDLQKEIEGLRAELATAKTAGEKATPAKLAEDIAAVLAERKMVSKEVVPATKEALMKEGGVVAYFKKACDLYQDAVKVARETKEALDKTQKPRAIGKPSEKVAGDRQDPKAAAAAAFEARIMAGSK
jgi:hypothetical protein